MAPRPDAKSYGTKTPLHIFCGISVSRSEAKAALESAAVHPPIKRGDIPAIVRSISPAGTIAVIDGVFHSQETVSLTEIREAIALGWMLIGCSSMGALRAVEAEPLGMGGFGRVYRWLKLFRIEDDDEVAQIVDPETFKALSLAMVDIRWQLSRLEKNGALSAATRAEIVSAIKSHYYPLRTSQLLSALLATHAGISLDLSTYGDLPKRRDALELLLQLKERVE